MEAGILTAVTENGVRRLLYALPEGEPGRTVGFVLKYRMGLSGTVARRIKWLPDGILLDARRVTTRHPVLPGQLLSARLSDPERRSGLLPAPGPLDIVWEDGDLVVLNKAPGVTVHPGPGHYADTLGNYLLYYYDSCSSEADFHPVHRLDKGTSGLMVVAKHAYAQEKLRQALHTKDFCREYLAVCEGTGLPEHGTISAPIGRQEGSIIAYCVRPDGLDARTEYRVLAESNGRSLLRLRLDTGRTHQIRVHLAHIGHPLTGDFLYGREDRELIPRPALHSCALGFAHPVTGARLEFSLPLPEDMAALLN